MLVDWRLKKLALVSLLATLLGWPVIASAQGNATGAAPAYAPCETKPTEGDTAAAKGAFQAGTAAYNEADYDRAITYWEDAFRRDCTATALLLNLARAYESSGQLEHAIVALRTYNERNAESPQRDQIDRRIERLQEQLDAQKKATPAVAAAAPTASKAPPPSQPKSTAAADKKSGPSAVPLVVAITGGAVALVGTAGYLKFASDTKKYEEQCPNRNCTLPNGDADLVTQDKANKAQKNQKVFGAIAVGGAVVGVAGAFWYYFETKRAARANASSSTATQITHWTPCVGTDYAGVNFEGQFSF